MMKRFMGFGAIGLSAALLSGCNERQPVACTAESAQAPVVQIVKDQLEKAVFADLRSDDGTHRVGLSKVRAVIAQLVVAIEDVRTSKEDPNSTKRFCTGTLSIRFPADALADADHTRTTSGLSSVSDLAAEDDVERQADRFTSSIDFNVQPTDDGSKVFAEAESGTGMLRFATEVVSSSLLRASLDDAKRQQDQAAAAQQQAEGAALTAQRDANMASAKTDNDLAVQTIGATWKALDAGTRAGLLAQQRAWIRKKDADCLVEAASASVDPSEHETARLQCDTRMTQERTAWLDKYRDGNAPAAPADAGSPARPNDL